MQQASFGYLKEKRMKMSQLINIVKPDFRFDDERGSLIQLVHQGYNQVNAVTTKAGVFRGGHYHKINKEVFFIISGRFKFTAERDDIKEEYEFKAGDMFEVLPYVYHSFDYLEDTVLVALYDKGVELVDGGMDTYSE